MKENKVIMMFFILFSVLVCTVSVYGIVYKQGMITNEIELGDVKIEIQEYEIADQTEIVYRGKRQILPGENISKIPRITNCAARCWIRVRLNFKNSRPELEGLYYELLQGIDPSWIRRGDYLYYISPLEKGESVDVFQGIRCPQEWGSEHSEQELSLEIIAEAIQAANFQPSFSTDSPWYDEKIQACVHEEDGEIILQKENMKLSVEVNEQARKLLTFPNDFFTNFHNAMPGDELYDSAGVYNNSDEPVRLYFRTDIPDLSEEDQALLDEISLQINYNSRAVYAGKLRADQLEKGIVLAQLPAKGKGILDFKVTIPGSLDNSYALRKTAVKWIFSAFQKEEGIQNNVRSGEVPVDMSAKNTQSRAGNAKTQDSSPVGFWLKVLIASGILVYLIWILKRKGVNSS